MQRPRALILLFFAACCIAQPRTAAPSIVTRVLPAGVWTNLAIFIGIGVFLGYLGFMGVPRFIDSVFLLRGDLFRHDFALGEVRID